MPTRNVVLTDHQTEFVDRLVSTGRYQNASEVLRDGLRLVEREESETQARLDALREAARVGIADADEGRYKTFESDLLLREHLQGLVDDELAPTRSRRRK